MEVVERAAQLLSSQCRCNSQKDGELHSRRLASLFLFLMFIFHYSRDYAAFLFLL